MGAAMAVVGLYQAYQQYQAGQYAKAVGNMQADAIHGIDRAVDRIEPYPHILQFKKHIGHH